MIQHSLQARVTSLVPMKGGLTVSGVRSLDSQASDFSPLNITGSGTEQCRNMVCLWLGSHLHSAHGADMLAIEPRSPALQLISYVPRPQIALRL